MSFGLKLFDILTANATAAKSYINRMLAKKQDKLTFDSTPTAGSSNPVTSDGIRKAIDTATPNVDFSNYPTKDGTGAAGTWPISISGAATKASQDSNGKVIADTYATKTDLDAVSKKAGIQANWDSTDNSSVDFIRNIPNSIKSIKNSSNFRIKSFYKVDNNGWPVYRIVEELIKYHPTNRPSDYRTYGFSVIELCDIRQGDGQRIEPAFMYASLGYEYDMLRSTSSEDFPVVLHNTESDKYYVAIRNNGSYKTVKLIGDFCNPDIELGEEILAQDGNGTPPSGWELTYSPKSMLNMSQLQAGRADDALKLAYTRWIKLTGDMTGDIYFDGSKDITVNTTVNESKHAAAATSWGTGTTALVNDIATVNNSDTWIPVIRDGKLQHTTKLDMKVGAAVSADTAARATTANNADKGNWEEKTDNRWYQMAFSLDSEFDWDPDNSFQYNPAANTLKAGTFQGALNGTAANTTTLNNRGNRNPAADGTKVVSGLNLYQVYNNGYPTSYGNVLSIGGTGGGEILAGWSGTDAGMERLYYRNQRDTGTLAWSAWKTVAYTDDISNYAPSKTGSGASGTWGINVSGSATNADKLDGYHENSFLRYRGAATATGEDTYWNQIGIKEYDNMLPKGVSGTYNFGAVVSLPGGSTRLDIWYNHQCSANGDGLWYRSGWSTDQKAWARLLDSNNFNNWAPTKTGTGASGTWPISVSGNAATATTATTATKANGLTGSLNFPDIGDVATSNKISWNGSTDGADIYYQTTASDQGNLVLNLRDDANCYLRIAYNGAFKSYFTPVDGNFHGNVNGKSDSAGSADTSAAINYSNIGTNYIKAGSADTGDAANQTANMVIGSWYGITFYDVCGNKIAGGMNVRDGSLTMKGTITGSKVYNAVYNDYAEFFEKDEDTAFEAGDIVALDTSSEEERYIKATEDSIVVVGVCTQEYAHIIGGKDQALEENEKEFVPVSLMGRVHVKVDDTVKRGDKVTASKVPGIGRKAMPGEHSIGTALTNPSNGKVRVLINL